MTVEPPLSSPLHLKWALQKLRQVH